MSIYEHISYGNRRDCSLVVVNRGPHREGFDICQLCGAAFPSVDRKLQLKQIKPPYRRDAKNQYALCSHNFERSVVIGDEFMTDLALFQIEIDRAEVCTSYENPWLKRASVSLAETFQLAAVDLLDIDFGELSVGVRRRFSGGKAIVEIYLFDSLSSGAGYSSLLANDQSLGRLVEKVDTLLSDCDCRYACQRCLQHFRNKRIHSLLDRNAARELLTYAMIGQVRTKPRMRGRELFTPLVSTLEQEQGVSTVLEGEVLRVLAAGRSIEVRVIPNMRNKETWCPYLQVWEDDIERNLPKVFDEVAHMLLL